MNSETNSDSNETPADQAGANGPDRSGGESKEPPPSDKAPKRPPKPAHAEQPAAEAASSAPPAPAEPSGSTLPEIGGVETDIDRPGLEEAPTLPGRIKTLLIGKPRDLADQSIFHHISLVAFLAWVGLGADGLSSSCYGPPEAFANLKPHYYLAVFIAVAIMATVFIIAACYRHIIEVFPTGGGGYLVASKLLGRRVGVVSGCALLVDYVMTITVSTAASGDAIFSLLDPRWLHLKLPAEFGIIILLILLNLRGVKESVQILLPIFLLFLLTHIILIGGSIGMHVSAAGAVAHDVARQVGEGIRSPQLGLLAMLRLLLYAYSMGAGTYTGLEAVSNSMPVMREPRVATGQRTMIYMAFSLAFTAGGLMIAYLLLGLQPSEDKTKTLNYILTLSFLDGTGLGRAGLGNAFLLATLLSEGALLFVGAQAGFIDGPRVLANMAHDSWVPRWFANLSERLATENGILLMGLSALAALFYTKGSVDALIIMYSINVFVTFSLSMIGMCRHWLQLRGQDPLWRRRLALFVVGAVLCVSILAVTVWEKFTVGGWLTIAVTGLCVLLCFLINRYYRKVGSKLKRLDETLGQLVTPGEPNLAEPDPKQATAVILVGGYSGLGIHTLLNAIRFAPNHFKNLVFVSAGVIDTGNFKGSGAVEDLRQHTEASLHQYVDLAQRMGMPSTSFMAIGTDAVDELEELCLYAAQAFPKAVVFAGQLVFQKDNWVHRLLHNQTAYSLQRRLQWAGLPMVILPTRVR
ncbi:MAG: APC family permease [Pirellulales bacterium]